MRDGLSWDGYATAWAALHGGYDPRTGSVWARGWLRLAYWLARLVVPSGVTPTGVTLIGLLLSAGVPVSAATLGAGAFAAAGLVLVSAVADSLDGAVAVLGGRGSRLGQVYDAVADRLSEACWLTALWLLGAPGWLVAFGGAVCWLHEYVRARAGVAGMREVGAVTVAERPTRVIVVVIGLLICGAVGLVSAELVPAAAATTLGIWIVLALLGFAQLAAAVRRALR
jgi:CDP-diacylglycerol--glycerol-3-phosphate 3-phosphatidyltransferase